jgi:hypothetical protein
MSERMRALINVLSTLEETSDGVQEQLGDIHSENLLGFIACLVTPGVAPVMEDFRKVAPGNRLKSLWMDAADLSKTAVVFGEKLSSFQAALHSADDSRLV